MDAWDDSLVPVVLLVVAGCKRVPWVKANDWTLFFLSLAVGIAAIYVKAGFPDDPTLAWTGLKVGAMASGLYSGAKKQLEAEGAQVDVK